MRKYLIVSLIIVFIPLMIHAVDKINDDYTETNLNSLHSFGLLSYGFHSNTFHLNYFYLRYNLTVSDLQFFTTLNGFKDTHIPETNYNMNILNNISLYDYGITYRFLNMMFLSLRGAAVYRLNYESILLFTPYYFSDNPTQFDAPAQYIPEFTTAPGIRFGIKTESLEIGYSQGDFRHLIPSAVILRYTGDNFYIKGTIQYEHANPAIFEPENFHIYGQLSSMINYPVGDFNIICIAEITTYYQNRTWLRLEEGLKYAGITLGIRELMVNDLYTLYEFSIKKELYELASIGFLFSTDGRIYAATEINF